MCKGVTDDKSDDEVTAMYRKIKVRDTGMRLSESDRELIQRTTKVVISISNDDYQGQSHRLSNWRTLSESG